MKRWPGLLLLFLLFMAAAVYMRLALFIPINWTDEGVIIYPMWRVAEGELPYRDFQHLYGPSVFLLGGLVFKLLGSDLLVIRYLLLAVKAATCVMVYLGARRISGTPFALIAYGFSVVLAGLIWNVSSVPYPSFFATALCLAGLLSFLACERRFLLGCAVAGLCFGLAASFKQTSGAFAFLGLALYLLNDQGGSGRRPGEGFAVLIRASRWFVLLFSAVFVCFYLAPRNPFWNFALLATPALFVTAHIGLRELRSPMNPENQLRNFWGTVALSLSFVLPLLGYGLWFASLGLGDEILFNTVSGIPSVVTWISTFPVPGLNFVLWQLACYGGFAAVAIWGGRSWQALQGARLASVAGLLALSLFGAGSLAVQGLQARGDDWWFWGSSDLLFALPVVMIWLSIAGWVRSQGSDASRGSVSRHRAFSLFVCYAPMAHLSLYPAGDIWHVLALLPACLPLLAYSLEGFWQIPALPRRRASAWRFAAATAIAALVLVSLFPAARDVLRARQLPPAFAESLPRATGVRGGSGAYMSSRSGGRLVRFLNREAQKDQPLFVLSAKSLFYFLTDRASPVQEYEFILYLSAYGMIDPQAARELVDQEEMIRRFEKLHPLIVEDMFDLHSENVRRTYPRLARFIDTHYRAAESFGAFQVLRWDAKPERL